MHGLARHRAPSTKTWPSGAGRAADDADVADEALDAGLDPRASGGERGARDEGQQRQRGEGDEEDHRDDERRPAARAVDRERRAAREGDDAGQAEGAVGGQVGLGDQETCAGAHQQMPRNTMALGPS